MRLIDLEPQFIRREERHDGIYHPYVDDLRTAQGIMFMCPKCYEANLGPIGTHAILCWFSNRDVPDFISPFNGRWNVGGKSYADLSLTPSIRLTAGCMWHGFVLNGLIINA